MRVPLSWLKEYVDVEMSADELADLITNAGLEVEKVEKIGVEGAPLVWERDKVLLGQVVLVEQHPDADKLVLAHVNYGGEQNKVVVTGAPNLKPFIGEGDLTDRQLFSAIIFEGGIYLNPYKDMKPTKLKGKALRGIYNDAMLCSEVELGLGEDHAGIMLFEKDALGPDLVAGTPLQDVLGDSVIDIDIIPNVARAASIVGVAREVAALTGKQLHSPNYSVVQEGEPIDGKVKITTTNPELNPRFVAYLIEGVRVTDDAGTAIPSPWWMRRRLALAGQRPINVVVDISNYVMLEMGQPNHTFDYDFMRSRADEYGGPVHIITRLAEESEVLKTLDGKEHKLFPNNILVTDPLGNLSLGGIMGGFNSEVEDHTTNVLLEAAAWNFINIRHSQRQLAIHTEAGFRFSRGVHPAQALLGAQRAAELLRTVAGGTVAQGNIDYYPAQPEPIQVQLNLDYAQKLSGLDLPMAHIAELLERLEFTIDALADDHLVATVPDHRIDVDGPHDLVEEFCRVYGYDNVPSTVIEDTLPPQRGNREYEVESGLKDALVKLGLQEIITYRLTTEEAENRALLDVKDDRPYLKLVNPSTLERVVLRHNLLASVLEIAAENTRHADRIAIFEAGHVYIVDEEEPLPREDARLAIVMTGKNSAENWLQSTPRPLDFYDLKGVLDGMFAELHIDVRYEAAEHPTFRPGRTANVYMGKSKKLIGTVGELHPLVAEQYDMRLDKGQAVLAATLNLELLIEETADEFALAPISQYEVIREDLALLVDMNVTAAKVEAAIVKAGGFLLKNVTLFDVYTGDNIPVGKKSLGYHLTYQSPNKTLKDKDVAKLRRKIVGALKATVGATLRE